MTQPEPTIELHVAAGPRLVTVSFEGYDGGALGAKERRAIQQAIHDAISAINDEVRRSRRRGNQASPKLESGK